MNNGNRRRYNKRARASRSYKIRYDRILAVVLVIIVLIVILTSCMKSCSGDSKKDSSSSDTTTSGSTEGSASSSTIVDNLETSGTPVTHTVTDTETEAPTAPEFTLETHAHSDIYRGDLVLVNADHEYTFPEDDANIAALSDLIDSDCYRVSDYIIKLDTKVITQLNALMKGFYTATQNFDIVVIGGYRTLAEQDDRYNSGSSGFKGGYSDYHTARSFDMGIFPTDGLSSSGYYAPMGEYAWISEHAAEYGFVERFPDGKEAFTGEEARTQTYRYVGVPHAAYMKQNDLCLEEYIDLLREHNNTDPIEFETDGKLYQIYFAPADDTGNTDIPVPANKVYDISGNNVDGFIVTVTMN